MRIGPGSNNAVITPPGSAQPSRAVSAGRGPAASQPSAHVLPGSRTSYSAQTPTNVPVGGGPISVSVRVPNNPQTGVTFVSSNNYLGRTVTYGGHGGQTFGSPSGHVVPRTADK